MSENRTQQNEPTYNTKSMQIIFEVYKNEYDAMQDNADAFENRAGVLITLSGALLVYEGSNFIIPKKNLLSGSLLVSIEILSIIFLVMAILTLILVITIRKFNRINHQPLAYELSSEKIQVVGMLIATYWEATIKTNDVVEKRAFWFNIGLWLLFADLVLVTISRII